MSPRPPTEGGGAGKGPRDNRPPTEQGDKGGRPPKNPIDPAKRRHSFTQLLRRDPYLRLAVLAVAVGLLGLTVHLWLPFAFLAGLPTGVWRTAQ